MLYSVSFVVKPHHCIMFIQPCWTALTFVLGSYIGDEESSRAAFDKKGFVRTGDLGKYENGQFYILGRTKFDCESSTAPSGVVELTVSKMCAFDILISRRPRLKELCLPFPI